MLKVGWRYPTIDDWQEHVLTHAGNLSLLCGRQVGKSEIAAKKIAEYLLNNRKKKLLIVSGVERQASGLYQKTLHYIQDSHPLALMNKRNRRPLKTKFELKNGSSLITEPLGIDGSGARQHTVDGIIFEEMQEIPEEAYAAITPMLLTTGGFIWMLGTARFTKGYAYDRLADDTFKVFRVNAEEVAEKRPEPQRTIMLNHLENEKKRLTAEQYAREYLAIPSDSTRQIFADELIARAMREERRTSFGYSTYICGVDPAGLGDDEGNISIFEFVNNDRLAQVEHIKTNNLYTTQTTDKILELNKRYNFTKIYIDDGGLGFGVFSELLRESATKNKVIPLNNSSRPLDWRGNKGKKILGEEMVTNLRKLMERNKISFLMEPEIRESLKSYIYDISKKTGKLSISSNYNHPVQAIMRAAWFLEQKPLKLSVHSIRV